MSEEQAYLDGYYDAVRDMVKLSENAPVKPLTNPYVKREV